MQVPDAQIARMAAVVAQDPQAMLCIDLGKSTVSWPGGQTAFKMKAGAREALLNGEWDALGQLLEAQPQVAALAAKLAYFKG